jgi:hypothetical protein
MSVDDLALAEDVQISAETQHVAAGKTSREGVTMDTKKPKWCAKCFLRIAPYDLRTIYQGVDYHQNCFLKLVREQADEEVQRAFLKRARFEGNQYTRAR